MNPRYRRLLIPGLLLCLLVIVVVSSVAHAAVPGPVVVSQMTDPRIVESSGLALSRAYTDLAYTVNDSGNEPLVFAIQVSTGRVVGVTRVEGGDLRDTEALSLDGEGTLWVSDTGDNFGRRDDAALYALHEPGRGDHTVTARRYPIAYPDGHPNVEALLINPMTGAKFLVSKGMSGTVYSLPDLSSGVNNATVVATGAPAVVTDGTFSVDGKSAVLRSYGAIFVVDPADWSVKQTVGAPAQKQGETITAEASGSVLVGSEGERSSLIRVTLPGPDAGPTPNPRPVPGSDDPPVSPLLYVVGAVAVGGVIGLGVAVAARRRRDVG